MRPSPLLILLLATTAAAQAPTPAPTAEEERVDLARRHYQSGSAYFEESRYDDAIRAFLESYRLSNRPQLLYNIAKCHDRKGDLARAVDYYRAYLAADPGALDRAVIEGAMERAEGQIGRLTILDVPDGAELFVDGVAVGTAPLPDAVRVTAGLREVEARPADRSPVRRGTITVPARGEASLSLPDPTPVVVKEVVREKLVPVVESRGPAWRVGWATAGAGAMVAIVGAVLLGASRPTQDGAASATSEPSWRTTQERARAMQTSGLALLGVGGVGAVVGVVSAFSLGRKQARASAWIDPGGGGITVAGGF